MSMQEITCPLSNMKVAEINSKYVDYIRNHELVEKYNIYDQVNSVEFDENFVRSIRHIFYGNKEFQEDYPNEFDLEIAVDNLIVDFRCAYENQLKFEQDPEYDIDPWKDEDTEHELEILTSNAIPVWIEQNGVLVKKFLDKRVINGSLWSAKN